MTPPDKNRPAVLVYDLQADADQFISRQLDLAEVDAFYAGSLKEARELLAGKKHISLVLVDLESVEEGLLLIREIYEDHPLMQSVAIVPQNQIKLLRQGMNHGAADFLVKPLSEKTFQEVLSNVMVAVQARREILRTRKKYVTMHKDLEIAGKIQHSMLPAPDLDHKNVSLFASLTPAADIGGDFFDYFFIDQTHLAFLIGDVSGKGISAALFMAVSRSLLRSNGLEKISPAKCLEKTNQMLTHNNDAGMFVTVFYGIVDLENGHLVYINAGHNPPYIVRNKGGLESLEKTGDMALGIFEENIYHQKETRLHSGDTIYLYTDGIVEAFDQTYQFFGNTRMEKNLEKQGSVSCRKLIESNLAELKKFTEGMAQSDDITAMALKIV